MKKFLNLKLKYKVFFSVTFLTTVMLLLISYACYRYFSVSYAKNAKDDSEYTLSTATASFRYAINSILMNTSHFISDNQVRKTMYDIQLGTGSYIDHYVALQDPMEALVQSHDYIAYATIIGKNGEFFTTAEKDGNHVSPFYLEWNLNDISHTALLKQYNLPFYVYSKVLPLVIPVTMLTSDFSVISNSDNDFTVMIILLLDANKINSYFENMKKSKDAVLYLADSNGIPLNLDSSSSIDPLASDLATQKFIGDNDELVFDKNFQNNIFHIQSKSIGTCGLKLISIVSQKALMSELKTVQAFIFNVWILSLIAVVILSSLLARFLTKPITGLVSVVEHMERGTYNNDYFPKYHDETGVLGERILSMYQNIQEQIEVIKAEEQALSKAEIQILTEQINPHFLYNTLECIRGEVLSGACGQAASMLESLGQYLRIGLSGGKAAITMKQELRHTEEYLKLINYRSHQSILFTCQADPEFTDFLIVKCILQPLVENSIKHGFSPEHVHSFAPAPAIHINVCSDKGGLLIQVMDNGYGIDIEKATNALYGQVTGNSHVGLNNIYKRLQSYYGSQVTITFHSVPYVQNTVSIHIPLNSQTIKVFQA